MCTVLPETVQFPAAPKLTGKPDDALALTVKSASPKTLAGSAPKVTVWLALFTVSELLPLLARKFESPAKVAATPLFVPAGYVPALISARLALFTVARPAA